MSVILGLAACGHRNSESGKRDDRERGGVAFHVGEAAHAVAKESGKAAVAAGKELSKGAKEAHRGWQNAAQKEKERQKEK